MKKQCLILEKERSYETQSFNTEGTSHYIKDGPRKHTQQAKQIQSCGELAHIPMFIWHEHERHKYQICCLENDKEYENSIQSN
jgi:hypothetical protein